MFVFEKCVGRKGCGRPRVEAAQLTSKEATTKAMAKCIGSDICSDTYVVDEGLKSIGLASR